MKKILIIAIVLGIGAGAYFYLNKDTKDDVKDEKTYTDLGTPSAPVIVTTAKDETPTEQGQRVIKAEDKNFDEYEKNEKEWLLKMETILGESDYEFYLDLRNRNEEEKMKAYKEFHDYLRQKHGDNFSYSISEDQSVREKEINTKYTREFLKKIGEEKFKLYLEARDQFNEALQRKSKNGHALVIEF